MINGKLTTVGKVLKLQLLVIVLVTGGFAAARDWPMALWPFLGGLAAFFPNLYFAIRINSSKERDAKQILRAFYAGESGKLLLTVVLFMLIFQLPEVKLLPLMVGFISALSIFWFALVMRENTDFL